MAFYADPSQPQLPGGFADRNYFLNADPTASWWAFLTQQGETGANNRDRYAQNQQSRYYGKYSVDAASDPNMGFYDWLQKNQPDLGAEYQNQSPEQRGDFTTRLYSPRGRWVNAG